MKQSKCKVTCHRILFSIGLAIAIIGLSAQVGLAQIPSDTAAVEDGSAAKASPTAAETRLQSLITEASQAQAAGQLKQAAALWAELLDSLSEDVEPIVKCRAHFSAGICYSQLREFEPSIFHFKNGLEVATPEAATEIPQALFYLGYGQLELGRMIEASLAGSTAAADVDQQTERAMELLTTSTQTLGRLQRRFPDFAGADQAAFFQGKAFEMLGRLEEAAQSYEKVLSVEDAAFTADARFGLADALTKLGQPSDALEQLSLIHI